MKSKGSSDIVTEAPPGGKSVDRSTLLVLLSDVLKKEHDKVENGRIRDAKTFKLRLESVRAFGYIASVYGSILKDSDLTDILKRLDALEEKDNGE